jgi:hypothetical protein
MPNKFGAGDIIVKRFTSPAVVVPTTAGSIVAVNTSIDSAQVQNLPATEWASFAARYQFYRVRSVKMIVFPVFPGAGSPTVGANGHSVLLVGDYLGASVPASAAQILSDERCKMFSTSKVFTFTATWDRNPNARLWAPTNALIPTANQYGIAYATPTGTALPASTDLFSYILEWDVELRGSQ